CLELQCPCRDESVSSAVMIGDSWRVSLVKAEQGSSGSAAPPPHIRSSLSPEVPDGNEPVITLNDHTAQSGDSQKRILPGRLFIFSGLIDLSLVQTLSGGETSASSEAQGQRDGRREVIVITVNVAQSYVLHVTENQSYRSSTLGPDCSSFQLVHIDEVEPEEPEEPDGTRGTRGTRWNQRNQVEREEPEEPGGTRGTRGTRWNERNQRNQVEPEEPEEPGGTRGTRGTKWNQVEPEEPSGTRWNQRNQVEPEEPEEPGGTRGTRGTRWNQVEPEEPSGTRWNQRNQVEPEEPEEPGGTRGTRWNQRNQRNQVEPEEPEEPEEPAQTLVPLAC
ncbi:unnamed protein product, partial [Pleuronectes platessa]